MNDPNHPRHRHSFAPGTPGLLPLDSMLELFDWYRRNLCGREIVDPRGYRVTFLDTDFVHLIKLTNRYGLEPKNRRMTIHQIQSGRIQFRAGQFDRQRAQELSWARSIIETPNMIVPNWQVLGRANPGDAYIKNFGDALNPVNRVLICGHAGKRRWAVTIFARDRFTAQQLHPVLWP